MHLTSSETDYRLARIPDGLTPEQRVDFQERFTAACKRAELKWGSPPGYTLRQRILGGLTTAYRLNRFTHLWGMQGLGHRAVKAMVRKAAEYGMTHSEYTKYCHWMRAQKKQERAVEDAELRRRERDAELQRRGFERKG